MLIVGMLEDSRRMQRFTSQTSAPATDQVRVGAGLLPSTLQLTLILSPGEADSGAAAEWRIAGPRGIAATWPLSSVICHLSSVNCHLSSVICHL